MSRTAQSRGLMPKGEVENSMGPTLQNQKSLTNSFQGNANIQSNVNSNANMSPGHQDQSAAFIAKKNQNGPFNHALRGAS